MNSLDQFFESQEDGIFYVGHASILIRLNGKTILCDPAGYEDPYLFSWFYFPDQIKDSRFFTVDYVYVSHVHKDHYDIGFLRNLSPQTQLLIMEQRETFERELQKENISYKTVKAEEDIELEPGIKIRGFINETNKVDSSAIFFSNNFAVYHGNDHWVDISKLEQFSQNQKINVACIPFAYIAWFPYCSANLTVKEIASKSENLVNQAMNYAVDAITRINPDVMIPFGSNLVHFTDAYSMLNLSVKAPTEFYDYAHAKRCSDSVEPLHAGDSILQTPKSGILVSKKKINTAEYRNQMNEHIQRQVKSYEELWNLYPQISDQEFLSTVRQRVSSFPETNQVIRIESHDGKKKLEVNTVKQEINFVQKWSSLQYSIHHYRLDDVASLAYFSGKTIFDDIVGTRRFTLERKPNLYCRKTFFWSLGL